MKLSQMPTERAALAMADLAEPAAHITEHPKLAEMFKSDQMKDMTVAQMVAVLLPALCRDCLDDTLRIISVLTGKNVEDVKKQPISVTIRDVKDSFDADLLSFFK